MSLLGSYRYTKNLPNHHQLPKMIRIVIGHQQSLAEECLAVAPSPLSLIVPSRNTRFPSALEERRMSHAKARWRNEVETPPYAPSRLGVRFQLATARSAAPNLLGN